MSEYKEYNEIKKLLSDRTWRLNNLYYIMDKDSKKTKFKLNPPQEEFLNNMHYLNVILKARQLGFTTFIQIFMLDCAIFNSNIRCGVIAHNRESVQAIFRDKIKFAYDNLPDFIKKERYTIQDSTTELLLSNNSSIRVGTSLRSGTFQYLHVSEFGKICAQFPAKAKEIVTGALNTVHSGQFIFIESTAEGREGPFFEICDEAQRIVRLKEELSPLDFKFHFYPWWKHPNYYLKDDYILITENDEEYFKKLEDQLSIKLTHEQKKWYIKKKKTQHDNMKREYPSYPDEAFEQSIEGSYYAKQMNMLEEKNQITNVPYNNTYPVHTFWDLGLDDSTTIWFVQCLPGGVYHVIDFYEWSDEPLTHYINIIKSKGYSYGEHNAPHDISVREYTSGNSRLETARNLGIEFKVLPKTAIMDGINAVRDILSRCFFDKIKCEKGLVSLRNYRREWNDNLGCFKESPRHDWSSHAADAFRYFAMNRSDYKKKMSKTRPNRGVWA